MSTTQKQEIAVLGSGSWATALVKILSENEQAAIHWWVRNPETAEHIRTYRHNPGYLSDVEIRPERVVQVSSSIREVLAPARWVVVAIPAAFVKEALSSTTADDWSSKKVVSGVKGVIPEDYLLVTQWISRQFELAEENMAVIAGPCHAEEIALERQSYLTIASLNFAISEAFARLMNCRYVKATPFDDLYGVEYCAIMKNIIAIGCGIAHGLGFGDNFQAVLVANALREMKALIDAVYPLHRELTHTAYLGDLLVTAYSQFSRNRTFGNMIGRGYSVKSAQMEMKMVAEGYYAAKGIYQISRKHGVVCPIMHGVYRILYEEVPAKKVFEKIRAELQ